MTKGERLEGIPTIFNFHVDEFRRVETPDEMRQFEEALKNSARIKDFDFSEANMRAQACYCVCGGLFDDCDELA